MDVWDVADERVEPVWVMIGAEPAWPALPAWHPLRSQVESASVARGPR